MIIILLGEIQRIAIFYDLVILTKTINIKNLLYIYLPLFVGVLLNQSEFTVLHLRYYSYNRENIKLFLCVLKSKGLTSNFIFLIKSVKRNINIWDVDSCCSQFGAVFIFSLKLLDRGFNGHSSIFVWNLKAVSSQDIDWSFAHSIYKHALQIENVCAL